MIRFASAVVALSAWFCTLAIAEQHALTERYETMGTIEARVGDTTYSMIVPYDVARNRPHAEQKAIMGTFLTINFLGHVVAPDGTPDRPILQVTLQKREGDMSLVSAELLDDLGYGAPLVMGGDGGRGALVSFELEDSVVSGKIEGMFLRLDGYAPNRSIAAGTTPIPATIELDVTLPPLQ